MIIDFRTRPPILGFLEMNNLFNSPLHHSIEPIPSREQKSMDLYFKEWQESGITHGCILGRDATGAWSGMPDEDIAEVRDMYPDKFFGFGSVDPSRGVQEIVEKAELGMKKYKLKGIVFEPGNSSTPMKADDRRLYPCYERITELGGLIIITLSPLLGPDLSYIDPVSVQRAARDFPKAKFIVAHAAYPFTSQMVGVCQSTPNVWMLPDSYAVVPSAPGGDDYLKGVDFLNGKQVLFGTAYPFINMKQAVDYTRNFGLKKEFLDRYFYKNARELLEIDPA